LRLPQGPEFEQTRRLLSQAKLHTVCQEAQCPNIYECFSRRTATFLILGDRCTRDCSFCAVQQGSPRIVDPDEPQRVAEAVVRMGLAYVVITSVSRDDLPDGGAGQFAAVINKIRMKNSAARIEVLIPDFQGNRDHINIVLEAGSDVINHNIETVPRLYATVRPQADYRRSLAVIGHIEATAAQTPTKSGLMLGLGETRREIEGVLKDLRSARCRLITIGQYLQPTPNHHPVVRYVPPEEFEYWRKTALEMGFDQAACTPLTRSSYQAHEIYNGIHS
jgi:lipoic acid synthetase